MKHLKASVLFIILTLAISCTSKNDASDPDHLNAQLIKVVIGATLKLDHGNSTEDYLIDFGKAQQLTNNAIIIYLSNDSHAKRTNADSLFKHDPGWKRNQYFEKTLIELDRMTIQPDGTVLVVTSKTKGAERANGAEIVLKKDGNSYKVVSSKITWIS